MSWSARLLIALALLIAGAAAATWMLARYDRAAHLLGVAPPPPAMVRTAQPLATPMPSGAGPAGDLAASPRITELEARLARVENAARQAVGSAGRTDALVVAFATRRAIDRGVPLGYLETLLVDRFGSRHPRAVATIITSARAPVSLDELIADYEKLGPELRGGGPQDSWWSNFQRELGTLVDIRHAEVPSPKPDARYRRAQARLEAGNVDAGLAETMRLPGAARAGPWVGKARRYIIAHRALDEIESSALLAGNGPER
ncbi:MAG: hypothetical protein H0V46_08485 [Sphingomonas sp.]|nr:hypothetical protein [Sphingomonas sp.]